MFTYLASIWNILWRFGIFYDWSPPSFVMWRGVLWPLEKLFLWSR
jgi:hypothetical protein